MSSRSTNTLAPSGVVVRHDAEGACRLEAWHHGGAPAAGRVLTTPAHLQEAESVGTSTIISTSIELLKQPNQTQVATVGSKMHVHISKACSGDCQAPVSPAAAPCFLPNQVPQHVKTKCGHLLLRVARHSAHNHNIKRACADSITKGIASTWKAFHRTWYCTARLPLATCMQQMRSTTTCCASPTTAPTTMTSHKLADSIKKCIASTPHAFQRTWYCTARLPLATCMQHMRSTTTWPSSSRLR